MGGTGFVSEELRLFHKACREGRTAEVVNMKSIPPDLLETRSAATGRTALHEACANGHRDTVETLLRLGADAQRVTYLGGETPLHLAVSSGERSLVFLLLRHGCDPNLPNSYGGTCFHYAGSAPTIANLLLRYDGKVSIQDRSGETPWDKVHKGCPGDRVLNKMMKEAYDFEERQRMQEAYAATKEEEDRTSAKRREASAAKKAAKTEKAASHYRAWRGGDNSGATSS
ncbi:unnamed protein product [Laminaria digitata]